MSAAATITVEIDPMIELGPLTIAWHGLMIAVGVIAGGWLAARYARERELRTEEILNLVGIVATHFTIVKLSFGSNRRQGGSNRRGRDHDRQSPTCLITASGAFPALRSG